MYSFLPCVKTAWMFVPCREPNMITISHSDSKDSAVPESWLSSTKKNNILSSSMGVFGCGLCASQEFKMTCEFPAATLNTFLTLTSIPL